LVDLRVFLFFKIMANYTKLFNSIITSTIWTEDDQTRLVWITMLALANQHGEIQASIPGLARVAGVSTEATEKAINKFLSPDAYSRTPDDEGRRIEVISGGWALLNHSKYRMMASKEDNKSANATRQQRFRLKKARNLTGDKFDHCVYCGDDAIGVDHIVPTSKGGTDESSNLVRACGRCNNHKSSRDLLQFLNDTTLPYELNPQTIMANPKLSQKVTLSNGLWNYVTQDRDIAEAEAEAEAYTEAMEEIEKDSCAVGAPTLASKKSRVKFTKPSIEELRAYAKEIGLPESDGDSMLEHWEGNGWKNGANKVVCWKSTMRRWERGGWHTSQKQAQQGKPKQSTTYATRHGNDNQEQYEIPDA
jgi:hypothetical protein